MSVNDSPNSKTIYEHYPHSFFLSREIVARPNTMAYCHYHNCYELYYLKDGIRDYLIVGKIYRIKKGDLVFIPPEEIHSTIRAGDGGYDRYLLYIQKNCMEDLLGKDAAGALFPCFSRSPRVASLTEAEQATAEYLLNHISNPEHPDIYRRICVCQILTMLNLHDYDTSDAPAPESVSTHRTVSQVISYIGTHYAEDLSLETLSKQLFLSPCHLSRIFKKMVGVSFVNYVNNIRVKEAKRLLLGSHYSILEIAELVGYQSNTHFDRVFKKITGMSPLEYRKDNSK